MDILKRKKKKNKRLNPNEMYFSLAELHKLKYVKVIYTDFEDKRHEVSTEVKFIGELLISLYFQTEEDGFDIECPQDVTLKFVTSDALYIAKSSLKEVIQTGNIVYFSINPPEKMTRRQSRKYARAELDRTCVLSIADDVGHRTTYLAKSLNMSACGILLYNLESFDSDDIMQEKLEMSKYDCYHVVVFLEQNIVLKLFARFVRDEYVDGTYRYAFQFLNMKQKNIDLICKCITNEQLKMIKLQMRYK